MQSAIFSIIIATILLQSSTLSFGFLFDKPKTSTPTTTTTSRSALSALVFTSRPSQTSTSSSFNADSFHSSNSIHSGSSSSFDNTNFLPSHIRIRQTNMSNKDQELAVKLTMDALKRFGYKIGNYPHSNPTEASAVISFIYRHTQSNCTIYCQ